MVSIDYYITIEDLSEKLEKFWKLSGDKIALIEESNATREGNPVFTAGGKYTAQGWTEWTQGFQYGSAILQYDATGDEAFLKVGRTGTLDKMYTHLTHMGVHDHGFNNLSTYGNLLRLIKEGKLQEDPWEKSYYELALRVSAAVQAARWTSLNEKGFIYSFNGPHSLFIDTLRSVRMLMVGHMLGGVLLGENDRRINLLDRAVKHVETTAEYSVYYGKGRDRYDKRGRTAHECIFNTIDGNFRSPGSQQGYSSRTTWTRGLAWAMLGFAEELEFLDFLPDDQLETIKDRQAIEGLMLNAAEATCDFYLENIPADGIPYWDTGAPGLKELGNYLYSPADPYNTFEPVDSSAATIAGQALLRLGKYLEEIGHTEDSKKYSQAGLTVLNTLLSDTYLSRDPDHEGLILHSIYHYPNGWDFQPEEDKVPYGESSMWGDYHAREFALYVQKMIREEPYYTFFNCVK